MRLKEYLEKDRLNEELLTEALLIEGILSAIQAGIDKVKEFGGNISGGVQARSELKSLDGKKAPGNENIKAACLELRAELAAKYADATPAVRAAFDVGLGKMGANSVSGTYLSRNYFTDYVAYCMLKPIFDVDRSTLVDKAKKVVADKFVGFVITAVTGIPNIDDIKDAAEMSAALVKASNNLGAKWKSLRVANPTM